MNEKGSSTFFGLAFLILFCIVGLDFIEKRIASFKKIKQKQSLLLCSKELNGEYSSFISKMEITNQALKATTLGKTMALFIPIPGLNLALKQSGEVVIKALIAAQTIMLVSLVKNMFNLIRKGCLISYSSFKTPYQHSAAFSRNALNEAKNRGKNEWTIYLTKGRYQIKSVFKLPSGKVSSKIKTGIFSLMSP